MSDDKSADDSDHRVKQMNEYREVQEHTRVLRDNSQQLNDLVNEMRWVASGGRGAVDPEKVARLVTAIRRTADDLEEMDIPDPYEVSDRE